jgi:molybdenum cofactor guanylyltransferase
MSTAAGIVLAGGRSSRMGTPKAALEWHGSTLLRRVAGIVARGVDGPVVVVQAPGQSLPALPATVELVEDAREGRGPLQGLAAGLAAVDGRADVAFAASTDLPFLHPAFVRRVVNALDDDHDVVLPLAHGFPQPLAGAYRVALRAVVDRLLVEDRRAFGHLLEASRVLRLDEAALLTDRGLAAGDPSLRSVVNLNERADYEATRAQPAPEVTVERSGRTTRTRAATLAAAARAAGVALDAHVVPALNGERVERDPELPLVEGDTVAFLPA